MEKSASIIELSKALVAFQAEMKSVSFDKENPYFKSRYATLTNIVETAQPILARHGLAVTQLTTGEGGVTTILVHTSGEYIGDTLTLTPSKNDPQGRGSAITYARRYSYASILGIVSDEDDDGNAASQAKPVVQEPKKKTALDQASEHLNKPKTLKEMVSEKAKLKFKTSDEFKAWRVDNDLAEDLSTATELQLSQIMLGMK